MAAKTHLKTALTIFAILFILAHLTFAAPPRYEIIDLGTLGGDQSGASFINDRGQIVGSAYNQQGNRHATLFDSTGNGNNIDLGTLGGINSWACSVNYSGQIVGYAENQQGYGRATLFDPNGSGKNIDLGTLGELRSNALSINNSGQIVGYARNEQGYQRATLFDPTGSGNNIDLGTLGGIHSKTRFINDRGQIVGNARIPRGYSHATLFDPTGGGNNIDLGTLGGSSSNVHSINNPGQIVGWAATDWLDNRATLFDPTGSGKNIELGTLGGRLSWAFSINDLGQIVGAAENQLRDTRATLFDPTGSGNNIDLNTLIDPAYGWTLKYTDSINNHGWIVGTGINPAGERRAFLMKPLPRIIYVDDNAAGANDGSSWADAFNYLQDALTAAWNGDEIHVAQGVYNPDQGAVVTTGDREATFQLINGVTLKGGYAGADTPDPNARDTELYETILSGDLDSNDVELENLDWNTIYLFAGHPSRAENSCHVVTGSGTDATAVLDGVTITCGNAYGPEPGYCENKDGSLTCGAGMYNDSGSPTLTNCTFYRNTSWTIYAYSCPEDSFDAGIRDFDVSFDLTDIFMVDTSGAGIYNCNSNMTLNNCMFEENIVFGADSSSAGGGIHNVNSDIVLINCIFKTNVAAGFDSHYWGGAIANSNSNPTLEGCSFIENLAYYDSGGALTLGSSTSATLTNCKFVGNAAEDGGAICGLGQATLTNCAFHENVATYSGGAIYNGSGNPTLVNCTFSRNSAEKGGGIFHDYMSSATMIDCVFKENFAGAGGGIYSYNHYGTLIVRACTFSANKAEGWGGGGMYMDSESNSIVTNCVFIANLSERYGGGIYNWGSDLTLTNCTFSENSANMGNALACYSWMQEYPSNLQATNCILWDGGDEIWNGDDSTIKVTYSDVQDGWPGEGNIDAAPLFVDPGYWEDQCNTPDTPWDDVWIDGNYHLLPDSPCIDTGDSNYIAEPNETDLDGRPRVINGRVDMGAYELPIFAEARILPRTINLASKGKLVTCYIRLSEDYDIADIDSNSVLLEDEIRPEQFSVDEQAQLATARFSREDVQPILEVGDIELTITCRLTDGAVFEATDTIKVVDKADKK